MRHSGLALETDRLADTGTASGAGVDRAAAARSRSARSVVIEDYTSSLAREAVVRLRVAGLCPAVEPTRCLREGEHGRVVGQDPAAGERLLRGQIVSLLVAEQAGESGHPDHVRQEPDRQGPRSSPDVCDEGLLLDGDVALVDPSEPRPPQRLDRGVGAARELRGCLNGAGLSDVERDLSVEAEIAGPRLGVHSGLDGGEGPGWGGLPQPGADSELRDESVRGPGRWVRGAWWRRLVTAVVAVAMVAPLAVVVVGGGDPSSPRSRAALVTAPVISAGAHAVAPAAVQRARARIVLGPRPARSRRRAARARALPVAIRKPSGAAAQVGGSPRAASVPWTAGEASSASRATQRPAPGVLRQGQHPVVSQGSSAAQFFRP